MDKTEAPPSPLGRHILLELYECSADLLRHPADAQRILLEAAHAMGATVVGAHFHAFSPYGVSGVVVIQESHLTIHTWPEYAYAAIDVFTCGPIDMAPGINLMAARFGARRSACRQFDRGEALILGAPQKEITT